MGRTRDRTTFTEPQRITLLEGDVDRSDAAALALGERVDTGLRELAEQADARFGKIQNSINAVLVVLVAAVLAFASNIILSATR